MSSNSPVQLVNFVFNLKSFLTDAVSISVDPIRSGIKVDTHILYNSNSEYTKKTKGTFTAKPCVLSCHSNRILLGVIILVLCNNQVSTQYTKN